MDVTELLLELFGRVPPLAEDAVEGLTDDQLVEAPRPGANTVAWLVWHLARVEDAQIADVAGTEQVWVHGDWAARFGREADPRDHGYGHTPEQVAGLRPQDRAVLTEYLGAVHEVSVDYLRELTAGDLDRIVDRNWDPPVTLGVRLVSIADDCLQHAGQAAYVRGLLLG